MNMLTLNLFAAPGRDAPHLSQPAAIAGGPLLRKR